MPDDPDAPPSGQVQRFLDKIEELQAVFVLSQRSLPLLQELFEFVQDVALLLGEVDATIRTRTGDMPRAASQLKSVSEATELATNEILDLTDAVLKQIKEMEQRQEALETCCDERAATDARITTMLEEELGEEHADLLARVDALMSEKQEQREESRARRAAVHEALAAMRAKVTRIMMSLQVQDITSQQIASVNHLIGSVRERMGNLLKRVGVEHGFGDAQAGDASSSDAGESSPSVSFDAEARYDQSPARQRAADDLIAELSERQATDGGRASPQPPPEAEEEPATDEQDGSADSAAPASQDEIDDLFASGDFAASSQAAPEAPGEAPSEAPAVESEAGELASEEDINQLFQ